MNYIRHLNSIFLLFTKDSRLNPTHVSLYMAFFQLWNHNRFPKQFYVNREEVMKLSKIGSKSTYHRCLKELDHYKYLIYFPSHNPFKGSQIKMLIFGTTSGQALDLAVPNQGQALVPLYKHNKQIENINKLDQPKNQKVVDEFFKSQNWPDIESKKFYNHYQGIGWKVGGKTKIVNWQATAQNWMLKAEEIKKKETPIAVSQIRDNLKTTKDKNYNQPL
ncbi:hypothetical protein FVF61_07185 [Formosa maritima]|uniref:Uncharacterized protein n=2 Tax=Formosa maritima TaxID=2592046 RepID=A0A5D0G9Z6_9FLAO|nr:hypothetical protein FVF61_07185 [Formosa maritima]